ncbi:hypothetical protein, partial [Comamonas sp.]|uniref:hypothetical protein n=1 Tax=Comamonas sp. TaxID=34028 RepID=UPI002FCA193D
KVPKELLANLLAESTSLRGVVAQISLREPLGSPHEHVSQFHAPLPHHQLAQLQRRFEVTGLVDHLA